MLEQSTRWARINRSVIQISLILLVFFFLPLNVVIDVSSSPGLVCVRIDYSSIDRTWDNVSLIYDNQFHDPNETQEEIDRLIDLVPDLVNLEVIGQSIQGRNISAVRITNELNPNQKAKTLVVAHHHGREQITVEFAIRFMLRLVNNYGIDANITSWIDTQEIYVIPTLNPDALELIVNHNLDYQCLRKNVRPFDNDNDGLIDEDPPEDVDGDGIISWYLITPKTNPGGFYYAWEGIDNDVDGRINEDEVGFVDLNRNYDSLWEWASGEPPESLNYAGPSPFSEPETRAFRDFALNHRFAMAYSLHSGINTTFFPRDENDRYPYSTIYQEIKADLAKILPSSYTSHSTSSNLPAGQGGLWQKWMVFERGTIVPITFELFQNASVDLDIIATVIVDNATHLIEEWKGIRWHNNPEEPYINDLWGDLYLAFDYILEMTPRLMIDVEAISGGINQGDDTTITFFLRNLSPRLGTVEPINLLSNDETILGTGPIVEGNQVTTSDISFNLPENIGTEDQVIVVGNNYTGYTQFNLSVSTVTTGSLYFPVFEFFIAIPILLVVSYSIRKNRVK